MVKCSDEQQQGEKVCSSQFQGTVYFLGKPEQQDRAGKMVQQIKVLVVQPKKAEQLYFDPWKPRMFPAEGRRREVTPQNCPLASPLAMACVHSHTSYVYMYTHTTNQLK